MSALQKISFFTIIFLFCTVCFSNEPTAKNSNHTDGHSIVPKLPALSKQQSKRNFELGQIACQLECVTPFGTLLGEVDGAKSFSNCRSTCINPTYSFLNLKTKKTVTGKSNPDETKFHYIGVIHQCVEYARKWWMINNGITFGSIDSAYEILYLEKGKNIHSNEHFPLARSINGTAQMAPKRGDLLIYGADRKNPNWQHGHVAVVVSVNLNKGDVFIAEENYNNQPWDNPKQYSRKIKISKTKTGYQVDDQDIHQNDPSQLGQISGWIYPLEIK